MGRTSFTQREDMRRIWSRLIWKIWISCSSLPNWGWLEFRRGETIQIWEQRQQREWWYASQNPSPKKVTKNWAHREPMASSKVEACSLPFLSPRPDWSDWLLPREQHITMEDASSLLVNSWTAMSVFLVQWSMFQTAPGSPFWIVLAQKLQFHYVSLALKPWYNWKNATKIIKTGNYVEPNSMFPFSASTAATFIYSVCG